MSLEKTLRDNRLFVIFSMALMTVAKSNRLLQDGGADPEAVQHIEKALELIARQLDSAAIQMEREIEALKNIDEISQKLGIPRAGIKKHDDKGEN
ncbi:hypothetical protein CEE37_00270 [candidate division LCP-89 bacterium B3_LCP]|uniref:Uncharacterized protein n=1 Tax=candidate division LCP-89 bacterium B3_LCP TaxID=2012998 RepID=A0A532V4L8_UNCL8|nr:MAG: hypothetical protein CEE37_00270 [candidate division LCP-89 bacterium B3_LCP]